MIPLLMMISKIYLNFLRVRFYPVFTNDDKYTREKLRTDLENLEAFYKDRGYLQFRPRFLQVSISDDLEELFITLIVKEGEQYTVSNTKISGDLPLRKRLLRGIYQYS